MRRLMRGRRRIAVAGVTLIEILVVLGLLATAFAMGFTATHSWRTRTGVRAAAQRLMADLTWARQRAMALGFPTGLGFAGSASSRGYVVVEGRGGDLSGGQEVRRVDWDDEDEGLVTYCGTWTGLPFTDDDVPALGAADPNAKAVLDRWGTTEQTRGRFLVYTANGTPLSRGLPSADGTRYIAVCLGARDAEGRLQQAGPSVTVCVSPLGEVRLVDGIPGFAPSAGGVQATPSGAPPQFPRGGAGGANHDPRIEALEVTPACDASMLPPGADAGATFLVRQDGSLSLMVAATDPDGDRLRCTWGGHGLADAGAVPLPESGRSVNRDATDGEWSCDPDMPMSFDPASRRWTSVAEWTPPEGATVGQWFSLGVCVQDGRGGGATRWIVVRLIAAGMSRICFNGETGGGTVMTYEGGGQTTGLVTCSEYGTEMVELPRAVNGVQKAVGYIANGQQLLTQRLDDLGSCAPHALWMHNVDDGSSVRVSALNGLSTAYPESPDVIALGADGSRLVYRYTPAGESDSEPDFYTRMQLWLSALDGSGRTLLVDPKLSLPWAQAWLRTDGTSPNLLVRFSSAGDIAAIVRGHLLVWKPNGSDRVHVCHPPAPDASPFSLSGGPPECFEWRPGSRPSLVVWAGGEIFEIRRNGESWVRGDTLLNADQARGESGIFHVGLDGRLVWKTGGIDVIADAFCLVENRAVALGRASTLQWMDRGRVLLWKPDEVPVFIPEFGRCSIFDPATGGSAMLPVHGCALFIVAPPMPP